MRLPHRGSHQRPNGHLHAYTSPRLEYDINKKGMRLSDRDSNQRHTGLLHACRYSPRLEGLRKKEGTRLSHGRIRTNDLPSTKILPLTALYRTYMMLPGSQWIQDPRALPATKCCKVTGKKKKGMYVPSTPGFEPRTYRKLKP